MFRGAPDIQTDAQRSRFSGGSVFLGRPRWSEVPLLSGRAFLMGFRTDFVTSVWVSDAFAGFLVPPADPAAGFRGGGQLGAGSQPRVPPKLKTPRI